MDRIERMEDEQLLVTVTIERGATERRWSVSIRRRYPYEQARGPGVLSDERRSPRRRPDQPKDVRLELGTARSKAPCTTSPSTASASPC